MSGRYWFEVSTLNRQQIRPVTSTIVLFITTWLLSFPDQ